MSRVIELEVCLEIRKAIEGKELDPASAMSIVTKGMELLNKYKDLKGTDKKTLLVKVLQDISAGNDGIIGTADDLLPQSTVEAIKKILDGDLISDIVNVIVDAARGKFDMKRATEVATKSVSVFKAVFEGVLKCLKKPKTKNT